MSYTSGFLLPTKLTSEQIDKMTTNERVDILDVRCPFGRKREALESFLAVLATGDVESIQRFHYQNAAGFTVKCTELGQRTGWNKLEREAVARVLTGMLAWIPMDAPVSIVPAGSKLVVMRRRLDRIDELLTEFRPDAAEMVSERRQLLAMIREESAAQQAA